LPGSSSAGILQINAGGTLELTGAVLNAATTTFTDELTPTGTYTVNNSVVDVTFADATGVLQLDDMTGFGGTIANFSAGDTILIDTTQAAQVAYTPGNSFLEVVQSGNTLDVLGTVAFASATLASDALTDGGIVTQVVACFAAGTRIATDAGFVAVEDLAVGDRVITADEPGQAATAVRPAPVAAGDRAVTDDGHGEALTGVATPAAGERIGRDGGPCEPIVWIGQRTVTCERHPRPETVWPVRVRAGAFGRNVPLRDLYLSPDHAVFVNNVLVPVKLLVNGTSIAQQRRPRVTYYHVELPRHAVILAEGLPVESYLDAGDRTNFHQDGATIRLFPDFAARLAPETASLWETRSAAPLVMTGTALEAARRLVVDRPRRRRA